MESSGHKSAQVFQQPRGVRVAAPLSFNNFSTCARGFDKVPRIANTKPVNKAQIGETWKTNWRQKLRIASTCGNHFKGFMSCTIGIKFDNIKGKGKCELK